jgi:hypothetical protein
MKRETTLIEILLKDVERLRKKDAVFKDLLEAIYTALDEEERHDAIALIEWALKNTQNRLDEI